LINSLEINQFKLVLLPKFIYLSLQFEWSKDNRIFGGVLEAFGTFDFGLIRNYN
jgi:hypothetical protein